MIFGITCIFTFLPFVARDILLLRLRSLIIGALNLKELRVSHFPRDISDIAEWFTGRLKSEEDF